MKHSPAKVPGLGRCGGAPCAGGDAIPQRAEDLRVAVTTPIPHQLPKASLPQFPPTAVRQPLYPKLLNFWAILVGPWDRGREGTVGVETRWGGRKPLSQAATELR